jgi:hypothetical protein
MAQALKLQGSPLMELTYGGRDKFLQLAQIAIFMVRVGDCYRRGARHPAACASSSEQNHRLPDLFILI